MEVKLAVPPALGFPEASEEPMRTVEVLRLQRCEQHGRLSQFGGQGGRCAEIQTKVLRLPLVCANDNVAYIWVSFPSLEVLSM